MKDYLQPISSEMIDFIKDLPNLSIGKNILFFEDEKAESFQKAEICLIGIPEFRGNLSDFDKTNFDEFRQSFYQLYPGNWAFSIMDLGNIEPGNTLQDTYFAMKAVLSFLKQNNKKVFILGGSQDLTYTQYRAFDEHQNRVNVSIIDYTFDLGLHEKQLETPAESYISKMIADEPHQLFNFHHIGYQSYCVSQEEIDLYDSLNFDYYRLGTIIENMEEAEPLLRDSEILSLDIQSVMNSFAPAQNLHNPNGFDGREICRLARYAGLSPILESFGLYEYQPFLDKNNQTALLIAQIFWYFLEGYSIRKENLDKDLKENQERYLVLLEDDEYIFIKNNKTQKWWMQLTIQHQNQDIIKLIPCSYQDYQTALKGEIPEKWWKTFKKYL